VACRGSGTLFETGTEKEINYYRLKPIALGAKDSRIPGFEQKSFY
jgi:hypothetical protein